MSRFFCFVAKIHTNLGNAYCNLGHLVKSKTILEKALALQEKYNGQDHYDVVLNLKFAGGA